MHCNLASRLVAVEQEHSGSFVVKSFGDGTTYAACSAADQCHAALESKPTVSVRTPVISDSQCSACHPRLQTEMKFFLTFKCGFSPTKQECWNSDGNIR